MCLMQVFVDRSDPLLQTNCPDDMVSDHRSDDHVGSVLIRCRSQADRIPDLG